MFILDLVHHRNTNINHLHFKFSSVMDIMRKRGQIMEEFVFHEYHKITKNSIIGKMSRVFLLKGQCFIFYVVFKMFNKY